MNPKKLEETKAQIVDISFTKGPWRVDGEDISSPDVPCINICAGDFGPTFYHICDVNSQLNEKSEKFELRRSDWANAHLIAAAPDMYESLSKLESFMSSKFKRQKEDGGIYFDDMEIEMMIRIAHQTLCKARGEL